jgi:uracil-DNA glycosylase
VTLGAFAYGALWSTLRAEGVDLPRPRPRFGHGLEVAAGALTIIGCFHPSQQNTFTGKLTESMLDAVFERARDVTAAR